MSGDHNMNQHGNINKHLHKPWVGLTQIDVDSWDLPDRPTVFEFVQFIETKIKEKNT
jgi:hypothetical protein